MTDYAANVLSVYPEKPADLDTQLFALRAARGVERQGRFASDIAVGPNLRIMQMKAIPCPMRLWTTLAGLPFGENTYVRSAAWNQIPTGLYAVPSGGITQLNPSVVVNGPRNITGKLTSGCAFVVGLAGPFTAGGSITVTVGGANGYTVTRPIPPWASSWVEVFYTPTPFDDGDYRAVDVTWTGGGTTYSSFIEYYQTYALIPATLPSGWTVVPGSAAGRHADPTRGGTLINPAFASLREFWRASSGRGLRHYYNSGGSVATPTSTLGVLNNHSAAEALDYPSELFTTGWIYEKFMPYLPRPFWDGTQFRRAGHAAGQWKGAQAWGVSTNLRVPKITGIKIFGEKYNPDNQVVQLEAGTPDAFGTWTPAGSSPVVYSGPWFHTGSGWEAFDVPITYPYDPDGNGWPAKLWLLLSVNYSFSSGPYYVAFHDPLPLPYSLPASDNTVIPGGFHPSSSAIAKGAIVAEKAYPTFSVSDIPTDQAPWAARMTDVPSGYYVLRLAQTSGSTVTIPAWGEHEIAPTSGIDSKHGMICTNGKLHWASYLNQMSGVSSFSNTQAASGLRWTSVSVTAITLAHKVLSLGANTIGASATDMGLTFPYTAPTDEYHFLFAKFTAPADGTYRFTHNRAKRIQPGIDASAVWMSKTDPMCAHLIPDLADTPRSFRADGASLGVISQPSAASPIGTVAERRAIIIGATGAWTGLDGWVAYGRDGGDGNGVVSWRLTNPPEDSFAYVANSTAYIKRNGAWVLESTVPLEIDVAMLAGETLYLRLGRLERPSLTWYGSGYLPGSPGVGLTITAM